VSPARCTDPEESSRLIFGFSGDELWSRGSHLNPVTVVCSHGMSHFAETRSHITPHPCAKPWGVDFPRPFLIGEFRLSSIGCLDTFAPFDTFRPKVAGKLLLQRLVSHRVDLACVLPLRDSRCDSCSAVRASPPPSGGIVLNQ
jgi:hypothetical protein